MNDNDVVSRNTTLLTTEVDGELLAMSIEQGACYGLNPVGTEIWNLLDSPRTVGAICAELVERFDVTSDTCRSEVDAFLTRMREESMIVVTPGA